MVDEGDSFGKHSDGLNCENSRLDNYPCDDDENYR